MSRRKYCGIGVSGLFFDSHHLPLLRVSADALARDSPSQMLEQAAGGRLPPLHLRLLLLSFFFFAAEKPLEEAGREADASAKSGRRILANLYVPTAPRQCAPVPREVAREGWKLGNPLAPSTTLSQLPCRTRVNSLKRCRGYGGIPHKLGLGSLLSIAGCNSGVCTIAQ